MWGARSKTFACVGFWVFMWVAVFLRSVVWASAVGCVGLGLQSGALRWPRRSCVGGACVVHAEAPAALVCACFRHVVDREVVWAAHAHVVGVIRSCGLCMLMWSMSLAHVVYA